MTDVIICLGDVFTKPKTIESMRLRVEKVTQLYRQERAKKIIFSGGFKTKKYLSEAKFMAEIAEKNGIPSKDIILEEKANTTVGNAYFSKKIMKEQRFKSAIVITSSHHLRRAKYIFRKVMPDKRFEFEKCKNNLSFLESIPYHLNEFWSLMKLKIGGINFSKL